MNTFEIDGQQVTNYTNLNQQRIRQYAMSVQWNKKQLVDTPIGVLSIGFEGDVLAVRVEKVHRTL